MAPTIIWSSPSTWMSCSRAPGRWCAGARGAPPPGSCTARSPWIRRSRARLRGARVELSAREFAVLEALLREPGTVVSRAKLEDSVYGWGEEVGSNLDRGAPAPPARKLSPGAHPQRARRRLPRRAHRLKSIRRDLVLWLTGTLVLGIAVVALATYGAALQQIQAIFDDELRQIAQAVHLREDWTESGNVRIARGMSLLRCAPTTTVGACSSRAACPAAARRAEDARCRVERGGYPRWSVARLYPRDPGGVVQVAQAEAVRDALARQLSLRMCSPSCCSSRCLPCWWRGC